MSPSALPLSLQVSTRRSKFTYKARPKRGINGRINFFHAKVTVWVLSNDFEREREEEDCFSVNRIELGQYILNRFLVFRLPKKSTGKISEY